MESEMDGGVGEAPPDEARDSDWTRFSKRLVEGIVPDVMRKTAAGALNTFLETEEGVRTLLGVISKEAVGYAREQIDRSRTEIVGLITREMHEFLDRVDVQKELEKLLANMTLEVKAEIRFVHDEAGELAPKVEVKSVEKSARKPRKAATDTAAKKKKPTARRKTTSSKK